MFERKDVILRISQERSFSKAADSLYISQPSLSAMVKRLEAKIGEPLFDRSQSPIELTECGREYVRAARDITVAEENFLTYLEEYRQHQTGSLSIGGSNLNISYVLPPLLHHFQKAYPNIHVHITEGNITATMEQLDKGTIDFLVDSCTVDTNRITEYIYQEECLILAVPKEFSCNRELEAYQLTREDILAGKQYLPQTPVVPMKRLEHLPFISLTQETDTYQRSVDIFRLQGFNPHVALSFSQQATAYNIICAGLGMGLISDVVVKNSLFDPELHYYKSGNEECLRHIRFYKKRIKRITAPMQAFLHLAQATAADHPEDPC